MGNVGKRSAMDNGRGVFQGLHQVGFNGILHQHGHSPFAAQLMYMHRVAVQVAADNNAAEPGFQVFQVLGQAQDGHDFRSHGNGESVLTGEAADFAAQAHYHVAQGTIVHVHNPAPGDLAGIQTQGVAVMDMVIDHGRQQVVGCGNGMHITGKMQVDVIHRYNLGITAAGCTALNTEDRSQGRFPQSYYGLLAHFVQSLGQANAGSGFAFASWGGSNGRNQDQFPIGFVLQAFQHIQGDFGFVVAILYQLFRQDSQAVSNLADGFHHIFLGYFDIA